MALIDTTTLLKVADRLAMQYSYLNTAVATLSGQGNGYYWALVSATDDVDVEVPTEANYQYVDNTLPDLNRMLRAGTPFGTIIGSMENHFNIRDNNGDPLQVGGWDGYLYSHSIRVSDYFNQMYHAFKGYTWLLAVNVFSETDDVFGTITLGAGPAVQFVDGVNYGTGSVLNLANGTNFAATQLRLVVGSMGATDADFTLSVKDVSNLPTTIDVHVPGGSVPGTVIAVGTTTDRFLDVMSVVYKTGGLHGTVGDVFTVRNLKERQVAL